MYTYITSHVTNGGHSAGTSGRMDIHRHLKSCDFTSCIIHLVLEQ